MKKSITLLVLLFIGLTSYGQELSDKQWVHIQKRTADWCPNCGTWGWAFKQSLLENYVDKPVLIWSAHHSGGLANETSKAVAGFYPAQGQPVFFFNGTNLRVNNTNTGDKLNETIVAADAVLDWSPFSICGADAFYDGSTITVNAKAKAIDDGGLYPTYLASYLMRKTLVSSQSGQGSEAVHTNLIMDQFTEEAKGKLISDDGFPKDSEFTMEGTVDIENIDLDDYSVVTIIWTDIDGTMTFVNASVNKINLLSDVDEDYLTGSSISVRDLGDNTLALDIESPIDATEAAVTISAINGQQVAYQSTDLVAGRQSVSIRTQDLSSGIYVVTLTANKKSISTQFYKN